MLWNASALEGYPIRATDGLIGTVADLMYLEGDWAVRCLVVDTGDWLSGRRVLLPVAALGQPDPEAHHLPVNLTMRQVEQSPAVDTSEPLSLESEGLVCQHYDLPHGRDHFIWAIHDRKPADSVVQDKTHQSTAGTDADIRIRSLAQITGYAIEATDGDIGHSEDFLIDTTGWQVRYLTVHTSAWWAGEKVLVSPLSIDWIDWARGIIMLDMTRQKLKDSPHYVPAETVDGAFEDLFYSYYGFRGAWR